MSRRLLTVLSGAGMVVALAVMLVLVAASSGDTAGGSRADTPFRAGALTVGLQDDQITGVIDDPVATRLDRIASSGVAFSRASSLLVQTSTT